MNSFLVDLQYSVRSLRRSGRVTIIVVVTLGLTIGLNATIFSAVNSVLFGSLPFRNAEMLFTLSVTDAISGTSTAVSYPEFNSWREELGSFDAIAALRRVQFRMETGSIEGAAVSRDFFTVLGVMPVLGRTFAAEEERPGNDRVAILSHRLWEQRFGRDRGILGRQLRIGDSSFTVIGILPPRIAFPLSADLWKPLPVSQDRRVRELAVLARLGVNRSVESAAGELRIAARRAAQEYPDTNRSVGAKMESLRQAMIGRFEPSLLMVQGVLISVLLIACGNLVSILGAHGIARQGDFAIRAALGAGRGRLMRILFMESTLLACIGGALGLLLAQWSIRFLSGAISVRIPIREIAIDRNVLLFTTALTFVSAFLTGLLPAINAGLRNLGVLLKGYSVPAGGAGMPRAPRWLALFQVSLAVALLAGCISAVRDFVRTVGNDPGFKTAGLLSVNVTLPESVYARADIQNGFRQVIERLEALPAVEAVGAVRTRPLIGWNPGASLTIEGQSLVEATRRPRVDEQPVTPDYFRAMGIPVVKGRAFGWEDMDPGSAVAIVNRAFVQLFAATDDPFSRRIKLLGTGGEGPWLTIVGIVGDVRQFGLGANPRPEVYLPSFSRSMAVMVKMRADARDGISLVRGKPQEVHPAILTSEAATMASILADSLFRSRTLAVLMSILAVLAVVLTSVGIYGTVSYSVVQRTREIGIRMALGQTRGGAVGFVLHKNLGFALFGEAVGFPLALLLIRLLDGFRFRLAPTDLSSIFLSVILLGLVGFAAAVLPARAVVRVNPANCLRLD